VAPEEPFDRLVVAFHIRVAEVEADPGVGLPSDIAEDGQLEPRVLVADVLDDDLDARVAAGVGDPPELLGGDLAELGVVAVGGGRVEDGLFRAQLAGGPKSRRW